MTDIFDLDDAEFTEIEKHSKNQQVLGPVVFSTIRLRGDVERISLNFSEEAIAKLEGWPRFKLSYNEKNLVLRLRASVHGPYEAYLFKSGRPRLKSKNKRYILRLPLQKGMQYVPNVKEPAPHKYSDDGATLNIQVPPAFRVIMHRPGVPAPKPGERLTPERLRELEPAKKYS